jgi:ankyrin repeat protein
VKRVKSNSEKERLHDDLLTFIRDNDLSGVEEMILSEGADIHYNMNEALRIACEGGDYAIVEFLLSKKAFVNVMDSAPLRIAIQSHHNHILDLLIRNIERSNKFPPLSEAVLAKNTKAVQILIEHDVDIGSKNHCALRNIKTEEIFNIIAAYYSEEQVREIGKDIPVESFSKEVHKKLTVLRKMSDTFGTNKKQVIKFFTTDAA